MKWSASYLGPGKGRAGKTGTKLIRKWSCMKKLFTSKYITYKAEKPKITLFLVNTFI